MALPQMDTAWRPDFGLGAYVSGQNAANTESSAQEELVKQFLANQRERQMQPLDVDVRAQEAGLARAKMADPEFNKWYLEMTKGQGKSMGAAGDAAQALLPYNIKNKIQEAETQNTQGDLLQRLWKLKQNAITGTGGSIGFDMSTDKPEIMQGFKWQISPEVQAQRDADALQLVEQEIKDNPNDPALKRYAETLRSKSQVRGPTQTIQTDNPQYEQLMRMLMDTPEFRQKLMQQDERLQSNEYLKMLALQNALDKAKIITGTEKPAKTAEETMQRIKAKELSGQKLTKEDVAAYNQAKEEFEYKYGVKVQPGIGAYIDKNNEFQLGNKPTTPQKTITPKKIDGQMSDTDLINKYLK